MKKRTKEQTHRATHLANLLLVIEECSPIHGDELRERAAIPDVKWHGVAMADAFNNGFLTVNPERDRADPGTLFILTMEGKGFINLSEDERKAFPLNFDLSKYEPPCPDEREGKDADA
ncbi:hypothetical protein [Vulgatibacter incomptus]|nr:hypothetical protein [Vulgatibacter incomptus]